MKKCFYALLVILLIIILLLIPKHENEHEANENTLYNIKIDNTYLRVQKYDNSLGQNQLVGVEKKTKDGYETVTEELITVSKEAKFVFLNKDLGFAISTPDLSKQNNYLGFKVTQDGGRTFKNCVINYDNPNIETLTVEGVPYYEKDKLKLHCSIYQIKKDNSGYEDVDLMFISNDNGLTWNLEKDN